MSKSHPKNYVEILSYNNEFQEMQMPQKMNTSLLNIEQIIVVLTNLKLTQQSQNIIQIEIKIFSLLCSYATRTFSMKGDEI